MAVISTRGRLRRSFLASAIGVDLEKARALDFRTAVTHALALMSHQPVAGMQPQVRKARTIVDEDRDTTHPVWSRNVLWSGAKSPWRRSPIWLLLRVSLQLNCAQLTGSVQRGNRLYKQAMLFFMSSIIKVSEPLCLRTELLHVMRAKLSWRLRKLGDEIDGPILEPIRAVINNNASIMSKRWVAIQHR